MTLTTHGIVGAGSALLLPQPLGWIVAFSSHYLLDAIPHWDYRLKAFGKSNGDNPEARHFAHNLLRIGVDFMLGLTLPILLFGNVEHSAWALLVGAVAAMLPDAFQFFHFVLPRQPFVFLQQVNEWAHSKEQKYNHHYRLHGIFYQLMFLAGVVLITWTLTT